MRHEALSVAISVWPFCTVTSTAASSALLLMVSVRGAAAFRIDSDGVTITGVCSGGG